MHDHSYTLTFLKTSFGYLTSNGYTSDICNPEIIVLPSNSYGKWSNMLGRVKRFLQECPNISLEDSNKLFDDITDCKTISFYCSKYSKMHCIGSCRETCDFWTGHRNKCNLNELFAL